MHGFNRAAMRLRVGLALFWCPPQAGEPKEISCAPNTAYRDFLGPAGDGRGFSIFFFCPLLPGEAPARRTQGSRLRTFCPT